MKGKNIIITALAVTLLIACKDKTYKPPTLDAMRSADKTVSAEIASGGKVFAPVETLIENVST